MKTPSTFCWGLMMGNIFRWYNRQMHVPGLKSEASTEVPQTCLIFKFASRPFFWDYRQHLFHKILSVKRDFFLPLPQSACSQGVVWLMEFSAEHCRVFNYKLPRGGCFCDWGCINTPELEKFGIIIYFVIF